VTSNLGESFFLSSHWLTACEQTWAGHCRFDKIELNNNHRDLGLVLVGVGTEIRHSILKSRVIAINESTDQDFDEVTIELNGFYNTNRSNFQDSFSALLNNLLQKPDWDELRFSGLIEEDSLSAARIARNLGLNTRVFRRRPSYSIDLCAVRNQFRGDYLATRSANTRQQLKRSLRALEAKLGPASLDRASSTTEALQWLQDLSPLHRARWPSSRKLIGFDNPKFVGFHENLIRASFDSGDIDLLRLSAGEKPIAYLYNLKSKGHIGFYLSGIDYSIAEQFRPGMLAHWLAIEHYLSAGANTYDFLAGQNLYKERLCTHQQEMLDLIFWRPRPLLRLENAIRNFKAGLRDRTTTSV
jgi:hypothetical protein